jgi:iron complex outermembrane receptor protein
MRRMVLLQVSSAAVAVALASHAQAQTSASSQTTQTAPASTNAGSQATAVGEVVVTSERRAEHLVDVPQSVQTFSSATMKQQGIITLDMLGQMTPGLAMNDRGTGVPDVTVRGVGSYGYVEGVGFYIDDAINFTDQTMRLQDVDNIEVLKGPQGTLYGGSSLGGAVRYITKQPTYTTSGEIELEGGTEDYEDVYAALNMPLVADKAAVRVSGFYTHDDTFQYDPNLHEPTSPLVEYGVRAQLLLQPVDHFTALFTVRLHEKDGGYAEYGPQNSNTDVSYDTNYPFQPVQRSTTWAGTSHLNYDFGFANLTSITSYTTQKNYALTDLDYDQSPVIGTTPTNNPPTTVATQELRLTSEGDSWISWVVGAYADRITDAELHGSPLLILQEGAKLIDPYDLASVEQESLAVFGSADFHLGRFTLTTGLRLDDTKYHATTYVASGKTYDESNTVIGNVALPRVSLSYKTDWDANLYATVSEGYEPGKVDVAVFPNPYKAETDWSYEIGAKGYAASRAIYYEVDAYYIKDQDRQFADIILSNGLLTRVVSNIGDSTNYGAEGSVNWRITPDVTLDAGAAYLHSYWDSGAVYDTKSVAGKEVPNSPDWTGNVGATYTAHLQDGYKLTLRAGGSYMGSFLWGLPYYGLTANTNPGYWLANARIALVSPNDRWELALRGTNIGDTKYLNFNDPDFYGPEMANGTCNGCHLGEAGDGQRIIASLDVKF